MRKALLTSLLLSTSVMAADDIFSAIKESKFSGSIRAKYFLTDWEDESKTTGVCLETLKEGTEVLAVIKVSDIIVGKF
ncbi:hypothetical protein [Sulfurihydrogenibium azorense]|jgi:hypothetical protein|uniref:hypothetical protein n=1 Tax=Sulfurihydrogenibium azorense TaxID=309806 RepID=UPI0002F36939|nr:hypothetical protein [Sulfurihydrogenibium azorense]